MEENENTFISDTEWENRILCSDEGCIGVIGPDGRCRECGRPFEGNLPEPLSPPATGDTEPATAPTTIPEALRPEKESAVDGEIAFASEEEWENRTLCSDDSCIGVIGPDGRCKECGRPFDGE